MDNGKTLYNYVDVFQCRKLTAASDPLLNKINIYDSQHCFSSRSFQNFVELAVKDSLRLKNLVSLRYKKKTVGCNVLTILQFHMSFHSLWTCFV